MANKIGLSEYHENNLRQLATYLLSGKLKAEFDMEWFTGHELFNEDDFTECGTAGCAAGQGPYAGMPKFKNESWVSYTERVFGLDSQRYAWSWCFDGEWASTDNSPEGAAKRILWALEKGIPDDWDDQRDKEAPLCYL